MELEKTIESFKRYINSQEQKLDDYYRMGEEFYKDEIEQLELSLKLLRTVLDHLTKQEKMIDELKNGVHYQECINCGKEIRVKRTDAKYCNECAKLKQKEYFINMSDEKKKERAEKSKQYMRELRAKRKAEESE